MDDLARLALGTLALRPYVFVFLAAHLVAAAGEWGWRGAGWFTLVAWGVALAAELSSTRVGFPFGLYAYTGLTRGRELFLGDVPFFDSLSFAFLAYASLGVARRLARHAAARGWAGARHPLALALGTGLLMTWLDLVVDPLAVRGDRWFLGPIFHYAEPGVYFGVPLSNFAGWLLVGATIAGTWLAVESRVAALPPDWVRRLPGRAHHPVLLYYAVLAFGLVVTATIGEPVLLLAGLAAHLPLAVAVLCSCLPVAGSPRVRHDG